MKNNVIAVIIGLGIGVLGKTAFKYFSENDYIDPNEKDPIQEGQKEKQEKKIEDIITKTKKQKKIKKQEKEEKEEEKEK